MNSETNRDMDYSCIILHVLFFEPPVQTTTIPEYGILSVQTEIFGP